MAIPASFSRKSATDDRYPSVAQGAGKVIGLQDQVARTLHRTEQGQFLALQDVQVAQSSERCWRAFATILPQGERISEVPLREPSNEHGRSRRVVISGSQAGSVLP